MSTCRICRNELRGLIQAGLQPICNRFLPNPTAESPTHALDIAQCTSCGVIQLVQPPPVDVLVSPHEWLTYNEPEGHLDRVSDLVAELVSDRASCSAVGLSYKDDSTLRRLRERGLGRTWQLDPAELGASVQRAGIETVQARLTPAVAATLAERHGRAEIVVARHMLEHSHEPLQLLAALAELVTLDGIVVLELPDCTRSLELLDYTMLWEEHVLYLTPQTFPGCVEAGGLAVRQLETYAYAVEDSLVLLASPNGDPRSPTLPGDLLAVERQRAEAFAAALPGQRDGWRRSLERWVEQGPVALFGAGHLSCMFVSLMGLEDLVTFVVDDNPYKQGTFLAGSRLPVRGSAALVEERVALCLLGVSPESEQAIVPKLEGFVASGGTVASFLPASPLALEAMA